MLNFTCRLEKWPRTLISIGRYAIKKKLIELVSVPFHVSNCKVYLFKMINHIILERKMHAIYVLIHLGDFLIIAIARIKSSESVYTCHLSNPYYLSWWHQWCQIRHTKNWRQAWSRVQDPSQWSWYYWHPWFWAFATSQRPTRLLWLEALELPPTCKWSQRMGFAEVRSILEVAFEIKASSGVAFQVRNLVQ